MFCFCLSLKSDAIKQLVSFFSCLRCEAIIFSNIVYRQGEGDLGRFIFYIDTSSSAQHPSTKCDTSCLRVSEQRCEQLYTYIEVARWGVPFFYYSNQLWIWLEKVIIKRKGNRRLEYRLSFFSDTERGNFSSLQAVLVELRRARSTVICLHSSRCINW